MDLSISKNKRFTNNLTRSQSYKINLVSKSLNLLTVSYLHLDISAISYNQNCGNTPPRNLRLNLSFLRLKLFYSIASRSVVQILLPNTRLVINHFKASRKMTRHQQSLTWQSLTWRCFDTTSI